MNDQKDYKLSGDWIETNNVGDTILPIGKNFPAQDYIPFGTVKFSWGTMRIIVAKKETPQGGKNLHVLSHGLWQFSQKVSTNPFQYGSKAIPRTFYINVESDVDATDPRYPFTPNRQGFKKQVEADIDRVRNYLFAMFRNTENLEHVEGYGAMRWIDDLGRASDAIDLTPEIDAKKRASIATFSDIDQGAIIELRDGKMFVDGAEVPEITKDNLGLSAIESADTWRIDQDTIDTGNPFVLSNMAFTEDVLNWGHRGEDLLDHLQAKYGSRLWNYLNQLGRVMMELRDQAELHGGSNYAGISQVAMGMAFFEKGHMGQHFTIPFHGIAINPGHSFVDARQTTTGIMRDADEARVSNQLRVANHMLEYILHEIVHFHVSPHNEKFIIELHNLSGDLNALAPMEDIRDDLKEIIRENWDIYTYISAQIGADRVQLTGRALPGESASTGRSGRDNKGKSGDRSKDGGKPGVSDQTRDSAADSGGSQIGFDFDERTPVEEPVEPAPGSVQVNLPGLMHTETKRLTKKAQEEIRIASVQKSILSDPEVSAADDVGPRQEIALQKLAESPDSRVLVESWPLASIHVENTPQGVVWVYRPGQIDDPTGRKVKHAKIFGTYHEAFDHAWDEYQRIIEMRPELMDEWAEDYDQFVPHGPRTDGSQIFPDPGVTVSLEKKGADQGFLTPEEAQAKLDSWKAKAKEIGQKHGEANKGKVILSLYDMSGSWAQPWRDAGFTVVQMDTYFGDDIMQINPLEFVGQIEATYGPIVGILSACPCTSYAGSGARWWAQQHDKPSKEWVEKKYGFWAAEYFDAPVEYANFLVHFTQLYVEITDTAFHVLENPVGRIQEIAGLPRPTAQFQPSNFGDPYTKRTQLFGKFSPDLPVANVDPVEGSKVQSKMSSSDPERSLTPEGFSYSFFMANYEAAMSKKAKLVTEIDGPGNPRIEVNGFPGGLTEEEIVKALQEYAEIQYQAGRIDEHGYTIGILRAGKLSSLILHIEDTREFGDINEWLDYQRELYKDWMSGKTSEQLSRAREIIDKAETIDELLKAQSKNIGDPEETHAAYRVPLYRSTAASELLYAKLAARARKTTLEGDEKRKRMQAREIAKAGMRSRELMERGHRYQAEDLRRSLAGWAGKSAKKHFGPRDLVTANALIAEFFAGAMQQERYWKYNRDLTIDTDTIKTTYPNLISQSESLEVRMMLREWYGDQQGYYATDRRLYPYRGFQALLEGKQDAENGVEPSPFRMREAYEALVNQRANPYKEGMLGSRHDYWEAYYYAKTGKHMEIGYDSMGRALKHLGIEKPKLRQEDIEQAKEWGNLYWMGIRRFEIEHNPDAYGKDKKRLAELTGKKPTGQAGMFEDEQLPEGTTPEDIERFQDFEAEVLDAEASKLIQRESLPPGAGVSRTITIGLRAGEAMKDVFKRWGADKDTAPDWYWTGENSIEMSAQAHQMMNAIRALTEAGKSGDNRFRKKVNDAIRVFEYMLLGTFSNTVTDGGEVSRDGTVLPGKRPFLTPQQLERTLLMMRDLEYTEGFQVVNLDSDIYVVGESNDALSGGQESLFQNKNQRERELKDPLDSLSEFKLGTVSTVTQIFSSGMSAQQDWQKSAAAGVPVGVQVGHLTGDRMNQIIRYSANGGFVFVDNGAVEALNETEKQAATGQEDMFGEGGVAIDDDFVMARYRNLINALIDAGADLEQLMIVAPDVVGNAEATDTMLAKHAEELRSWLQAGARIVVPIQNREDMTPAESWQYTVTEVLGVDFPTGGLTAGIPTNDAAMSELGFLDLLDQIGTSRIHILGGVDSAAARSRLDAIAGSGKRVLGHDGRQLVPQGRCDGRAGPGD